MSSSYKTDWLRMVEDQELSELLEGAEKGYPDAQFVLANKYRLGDGVPQDDQEAVKWYQRAAQRPVSLKAKTFLALLLLGFYFATGSTGSERFVATGLILLHGLLAFGIFFLMTTAYIPLSSRWKLRVDAVLGLCEVALLAAIFIVYGWRAGLVAVGLSVVYVNLLNPFAGEVALKWMILGSVLGLGKATRAIGVKYALPVLFFVALIGLGLLPQ